jgi:hypothetical protein
MQRIKALFATTLLVLAVSLTIHAGDMGTPGITNPPDCTTSPCTQSTDPGDMGTPGVTTTSATDTSYDAWDLLITGVITIL